MKTIHFNTGRKYTAAGQRITATLHDDNVVTFHDHDRMIDGGFRLAPLRDLTSRIVMAHYDSGGYEASRRTWEDAFQKDGCNAKFEENQK